MATSAEIQTMLTEARAARHQIALGQTVVEVWRDGRRIIFSKTDSAKLADYIAALENELADALVEEGGCRVRRRRPISVRYR